MKLLIIGPYPVPNNGMSDYIAQYCREFRRRGHEVETERMYFWLEKRSFARWLFLRKRLREGFDAILINHTPTASGPLLGLFLSAARRSQVKTVIIGHEPPSIYSKHLPSWLKPGYHVYERGIFSGAEHGIVHTEMHAEELRNLGVKAKPVIIPIPVYGESPGAARQRHDWGASSEESPSPKAAAIWGYYGMISPKKGLDLLLAAYQGHPPGYFPPLHILGGAAPGQDAYVAALRGRILPEYREHIHFTGYVAESDLPQAFSRLSLMIFPYRWVSQSAALGQTCFHRLPYLAVDLPYFRDFHRKHGCGRLFPENSVMGLREAMEMALTQPLRAEDLPFDTLIHDLSLAHCADQVLSLVARHGT